MKSIQLIYYIWKYQNEIYEGGEVISLRAISIYRNVTPHFENLKYRRLPKNIVLVTEFMRIDIVECQSQPVFFDSPFTLLLLLPHSS